MMEDKLPTSGNKEPVLGKVFKRLLTSLEKNNAVLDQISRKLDLGPSESVTYDKGGTSNSENTNARKDKVIVEIKLTFMKINDIDTVDQQFEAELFVQAKWQEPLFNDTSVKEFDPNIMWMPKMFILNLDGEFQMARESYAIKYNEPGYKYPVVVLLWRFKGFFKENLELQHFPMDVQDLTISISTERASCEVDLIEDQHSLSSVNTKTFMDAQEWSIYDHVETYRDQTTVEYASSTVHPILYIQCRVARKVGYFVWNIIFIVLLIISLTFATFAIEPSSSDRLAVTITLFLTAVAFKLVVKQSLPTISYLTYLDLYVLAALMFLGLHATQNACLKHLAKIYKENEVAEYDIYSMSSLAIIFVLFHVIFTVYIMITASKRRRIMKEKDKLYETKREHLEKYGQEKDNKILPKPRGSLETILTAA